MHAMQVLYQLHRASGLRCMLLNSHSDEITDSSGQREGITVMICKRKMVLGQPAALARTEVGRVEDTPTEDRSRQPAWAWGP